MSGRAYSLGVLWGIVVGVASVWIGSGDSPLLLKAMLWTGAALIVLSAVLALFREQP